VGGRSSTGWCGELNARGGAWLGTTCVVSASWFLNNLRRLPDVDKHHEDLEKHISLKRYSNQFSSTSQVRRTLISPMSFRLVPPPGGVDGNADLCRLCQCQNLKNSSYGEGAARAWCQGPGNPVLLLTLWKEFLCILASILSKGANRVPPFDSRVWSSTADTGMALPQLKMKRTLRGKTLRSINEPFLQETLSSSCLAGVVSMNTV
jgi:hypothetical protein